MELQPDPEYPDRTIIQYANEKEYIHVRADTLLGFGRGMLQMAGLVRAPEAGFTQSLRNDTVAKAGRRLVKDAEWSRKHRVPERISLEQERLGTQICAHFETLAE